MNMDVRRLYNNLFNHELAVNREEPVAGLCRGRTGQFFSDDGHDPDDGADAAALRRCRAAFGGSESGWLHADVWHWASDAQLRGVVFRVDVALLSRGTRRRDA